MKVYLLSFQKSSLIILLILFFTGTLHAQWIQTKGPCGGSVHRFAVNGDYLFAATGGGGVFRSNDNGTSWDPASNGLLDPNVSSFAVSGTNIFAGTGEGVFLSTNSGKNWTEIKNGMLSYSIFAFAVADTYLFAGTDASGVWKRPLSEITSVNPFINNQPEQYGLGQNYPNPFNSATSIEYQVARQSYVDLSIYNLLGQKVATLVSEKQPAGNYKLEWNASGFTSGLYFYSLKADNIFVESRKLILLK